MQSLKTALVAGAIALAGTMAFGQGATVNDSTNIQHNAGTDKGTAKPSAMAPDADVNAKASVKAPGANATTGAEISEKNKTGSRAGEDTTSSANMNKTR